MNYLPISTFPTCPRPSPKLSVFSIALTCLAELTNPQELGTIFLGYTIVSSKILRDSMGNSRGVGFARYVLARSFLLRLRLTS